MHVSQVQNEKENDPGSGGRLMVEVLSSFIFGYLEMYHCVILSGDNGKHNLFFFTF